MAENKLLGLKRLGQSVWLDNLTRDYLDSGRFERWISEDGVCGVTSNPTIFEKAITSSAAYDKDIKRLAQAGLSPERIFEELAVEDIRRAADIFRPVHDRSGGADGFISIEVPPALAHDADATLIKGRELFKKIGRPNVMIKVPATRAGLRAVKLLIFEGVHVNATLLFSPRRYEETALAYIEGLEWRYRRGLQVDSVNSVASFFVSRIDTEIDALLDEAAANASDPARKNRLLGLRGKTAIANSKEAYKAFSSIFATSESFLRMRANGARVQRILWASTGAKNPAYPPTVYVDGLIGADTVNTMPEKTLDAFRGAGTLAETVDKNYCTAAVLLEEIREQGVKLDDAYDRLEKNGIAQFARSYDLLTEAIAAKIKTL
ncbi:MAG: transaldolase [Elusimicrobiaceae bacterium]|nr:transaldolase [Elusimicrobiaceae bacterium]